MLLVVGMPLLLLELALGQKLRVGAARAWYKVSDKIADILDPVKATRIFMGNVLQKVYL